MTAPITPPQRVLEVPPDRRIWPVIANNRTLTVPEDE
ncbi:hypothetical protein C1Y40_04638 [Mycobacterium talmoniae]|uniref:Uncharacterized protein n=1 Tax=Mycobacterium talmoniae TaxID=1858794 RepID=A0A2S8BEY6_9MYCO|nr:hypothetical protein C1Y40_04638 [Mycobacterium talmoniae]